MNIEKFKSLVESIKDQNETLYSAVMEGIDSIYSDDEEDEFDWRKFTINLLDENFERIEPQKSSAEWGGMDVWKLQDNSYQGKFVCLNESDIEYFTREYIDEVDYEYESEILKSIDAQFSDKDEIVKFVEDIKLDMEDNMSKDESRLDYLREQLGEDSEKVKLDDKEIDDLDEAELDEVAKKFKENYSGDSKLESWEDNALDYLTREVLGIIRQYEDKIRDVDSSVIDRVVRKIDMLLGNALIDSNSEARFESAKGGIWSKEVHDDVPVGQTQKKLGISKNKTVKSEYKGDPKGLAKDLLKANKEDYRKTAGELGFTANLRGEPLYKQALKELEKLRKQRDAEKKEK